MTNLHDYSRVALEKGSKSFAKATKLFPPALRHDVTLLYAWCRHCDDVIDGQDHGFAAGAPPTPAMQQAALAELQRETHAIYTGQLATIPAFQALQQVVQRHTIPQDDVQDLLTGFQMDVERMAFITLGDTLTYSYHVAGIVGVMMARIMGVCDRDTLCRASDLGLAFQLTNMARDLLDDAAIGRCYVPQEWLHAAQITAIDLSLTQHRAVLQKMGHALLQTAEPYYHSALIGIGRLPWRAGWAIAAALLIYRDIGRLIEQAGEQAWDRRISTGRGRKLWRLVQGGFYAAWLKMTAWRYCADRRQNLWTSPQLIDPAISNTPL